jgi:proteasome lid subunit RPN8/RPN11
MDDNSFTSSLPRENEVGLSPSIQLALSEIRKAFADQKIKAVSWNESYIAIPLILKINLPSRGTVNDVDIRRDEPIFLLLERQNYPYKAPLAGSNRRDFPKDRLPHLNPKPPGNPASFCLHRGSIDTWFSEHSIIDYIQRIQFWFSDAASDRLIRKEDGFEVTRIDEFSGFCIYESSHLQDKVKKEWQSSRNKSGFCFVPYILLKSSEKEPFIDGKSFFTIKMENPLTDNIPNKIIELKKEINAFHTDSNRSDCHLYGILAWPPKKMIYKRFFADLPGKLDEMVSFSDKIEIPLNKGLNSYFSKNLHLLAGIPITLVIPRPQHVLKTESNLELLNFMIYCDTKTKSLKDEKSLESKVSPMIQRSPFTLQLAKKISRLPSDFDIGKILFLGCGAIGSKFALHIIKGGQTQKITFVDNDVLSSHNLVRHGLLTEGLGMNKAQAMKDVVENVYSADKDSISVDAIKGNIIDLFLGKNHEVFCQHTWMIDATASPIIRDIILRENLPSSLSICRCEIADDGKLGFLSIEGPNRNPRLDDLLFFILDLAIDHPEISNWLMSTKNQRDSNPETILEEIAIGMSCSSETMRLADDSVSFHASLFSLGFRKIAQKKSANNNGFLQISYNDIDHESNCVVQSYDIAPVSKIKGENDKNWQIRVMAKVRDELMQHLCESGRNETGGLLIGQIDPKKKIIYVTRILPAPLDSKCGPYAFERGVQDVPEDITRIVQLSGGMIDYVGEWHTHPNGGKKLSIIDYDAVKKIKKVLDPVLRPTFVMIVTKEGLYPYIFSTGS